MLHIARHNLTQALLVNDGDCLEWWGRAWEWKEFEKQWGRLMVAKTGKTFKLWSIQGSPDLFLLIIYDLSFIDEVKVKGVSKQELPLTLYALYEYPVRFVLSV